MYYAADENQNNYVTVPATREAEEGAAQNVNESSSESAENEEEEEESCSDDEDDDNNNKTRSGRSVRAPRRLIEEIGAATMAQMTEPVHRMQAGCRPEEQNHEIDIAGAAAELQGRIRPRIAESRCPSDGRFNHQLQARRSCLPVAQETK